MSKQKLPRVLPLRKSATAGVEISGYIAGEDLSRVGEAVESARQDFAVKMRLGYNDSRKMVVDIKVTGVLNMECQRCLDPVEINIATDSTLLVVAHDEEAKAAIKESEPLVIDDDQLDVYGLIEDEILLSLPIIPMHQSEKASIADATNMDSMNSEAVLPNTETATVRAQRDNPFDVLVNLKSKT